MNGLVEEIVWSVVFYTEDNGTCPVREFLVSLDAKTQVRFAWSIEQLRLRNVAAREPLVRHLDGKLWELVEARKAAGLTQAELARRLGVSQAQVARIEKCGYDSYTLNTLRRYVQALGRTLEVTVM